MNNQPDIRTYFELQPLLPIVEWWQFALMLCAVGMFLGWSVWLYRRDTAKLRTPIAIALTTLRVATMALVLVYFLSPGKRTETRITKDSRIAILVDTSLSMGLSDEDGPPSSIANNARNATRSEQVAQWVKQQSPIQRLQADHEVTVYRFDKDAQPEQVASFPKLRSNDGEKETDSVPVGEAQLKTIRTSRRFAAVAFVLAAISLFSLALWAWQRIKEPESASFWAAISLLSCLVCGVFFGIADLSASEFDLLTSIGWKKAPAVLDRSSDVDLALNESQLDPAPTVSDIDWQDRLSARGGSTRLGSAIEFIVNRERAGPIAGIVVLTDGQSNAGKLPQAAVAAAANASIPLYPIGVGSNVTPPNIAVADVQAPPRVFPGDRFKVKALVTSFGLEGSSAKARLFSIDADETEAEIEEAEDSIRLGADGEPVPVSFDVQRSEEGKRKYIVRIIPLEQEREVRDNQRSADVSIVERKTNVLLIAGGPTREFRFLRNQLYRDKSVTTHVWLQSAKPGSDQESDVLLDSFPETKNEMYFFDCVIAFDPDWRALSADQSELLERWVAEQAGGMILVAGPVNTPEWTRRPRGDKAIDPLRKLYPVSFYSQGSAVLKLGRFGGDKAYPIEFTREGRAAEYLWLDDSSARSSETWDSFDGVFGYYAVNESKAGANVLAFFADPNTMVGDRLPIYLASQFYGAGRVFFQASGEMWRVRRMNVDYFEAYYNRLVRWASQGRLMRDSKRGVLLADRQRCWMGDNVNLQAILRDAQDQPLSMSEVTATILRPDDTTDSIVLRSNSAAVRPGTFSGQFIAAIEGDYRISLPIPDSPDLETLATTVRSSIPDLEKERPQRNDKLLQEMADKTEGYYYRGFEAFSVSPESESAPENLIQLRDQETLLTGALDRVFKRKLMMWLMALIAISLTLEWTTRRLHRLA
jgi:hypothetical protein